MKKTSSELLLLDLNVLLAIAWPNHQFHGTAIAALSSRKRWATLCVNTTRIHSALFQSRGDTHGQEPA